MGLNRVIVTGRLTREIELKQINDKMTVAKFALAVDLYSKGEKETLFLDCNLWNNLAIRCSTVLRKGSLILIEGKLKQEKWIDKDTAKERTKILVVGDNVVFLDPKEQQLEKKDDDEFGQTIPNTIDIIDMQLPF